MARLAGPDDVEHIARLLESFMAHEGYAGPGHDAVARCVRRLIEDPQTDYLLAGDPPAGVAQVRYRWSVWTDAEDAWLEDLFVTEDARRSGYGRELVQAAIERARERGCKRIELDVQVPNERARALYESVGFGAKGAGAIYMQKRLAG